MDILRVHVPVRPCMCCTQAQGGADRVPAHAGTLQPFGLEGWRFAFVILGVISGCIGVVNFFFSADPRCMRGGARPDVDLHKEEVSLASAVQGMRSVLCVPTFLIVVFQARPRCPAFGARCWARL